MILTKEQRLEAFKTGYKELKEKYKIEFVPVLEYTTTGIITQLTLIDLDDTADKP